MYMRRCAVAKQHSIAEARNNLPSLVRAAESGKAVELTRRGEPVAVLIGRRQYERLILKYRGFSEAYEEFTREIDLDELAIDPDELFAGARDQSHGREVDL
jgi:prevent-host-death family protein